MWPFARKPSTKAPQTVAPKRKRGRPTREESAQRRREKLQDAKVQLELRRMELELQRMGESDELAIDLGALPELKRRLSAAGLTIVPLGEGPVDESSGRGLLRDLINSDAGQVLAATLGQGLLGRLQTPQTATQTVITEPQAVQQIPAAAPTAPSTSGEPSGDATNPPMTIMAGLIVSQLDSKTPAEAAEWLLSQERAAPFVDLIQQTADDDIPAALGELSQRGPDFAAVVGWLRTRPEWFMETVRHVRQLVEQGETEPRGNKPQSKRRKAGDMGI